MLFEAFLYPLNTDFEIYLLLFNCNRNECLYVEQKACASGMKESLMLCCVPLNLNDDMQIAILSKTASDSLMQAVQQAGMEPVLTTTHLENYAGYVIPDSLSSNILLPFSSKPILGIGNGAVFLIQAGWVPGTENLKSVIKLCDVMMADQVDIQPTLGFQYNAFTRYLLPKTRLSLAIYSNQRCVIPPGMQRELAENGLAIFEEKDGAILAISNKAGNIMAMLPHPESHPSGQVIFKSMRDYIQKGFKQDVVPLFYYPR